MVGKDVCAVAAGDHLGGSEVFEDLTLRCVVWVDAAIGPDSQEDLRLDGWIGPPTEAWSIFRPVTASTCSGRRTSGRGAAV